MYVKIPINTNDCSILFDKMRFSKAMLNGSFSATGLIFCPRIRIVIITIAMRNSKIAICSIVSLRTVSLSKLFDNELKPYTIDEICYQFRQIKRWKNIDNATPMTRMSWISLPFLSFDSRLLCLDYAISFSTRLFVCFL